MKKFKITLNAPVTLTFVLLCFIATLLGVITKGFLTQLLFMTYKSSFINPLTYLRMFTHVIGHGGFDHFIGNAAYLLLLGPILEEKYKGKRIVLLIIITAVVTSIINMILFPHTGLCGASGVVFAFILLTSITGIKEGEIPLSFILVAIVFIGQQVFEGITSSDNVSQLTHIIGGVIGSLVGFRFNKKK